MTNPEINLSLRAVLGVALFLLGLVLLSYVVWNAVYLAGGVFAPLRVQVTDATGKPLITSVESQVLLGIVVQTGMYALVVAAAALLLKYGLSIARAR